MTTERDVLRELQAALDVSPSPDFEVRVRARVSTQSMDVSRGTWPAVAAVAATVVLAVVLLPDGDSPVRSAVVRPEASAPVAPTPEVRRMSDTSPLPVEPSRTAPVARTRRTGASVESDVDSPAVIVPAGQMAAIQRLMREVAAGRVVMGPERPALPEVLQVSALSEAAPIAFDTIRFTPLSVDASPDLWR